MKIEQHFVTNNRCYQQHRYLGSFKLMLHSVGCAQPSAAVFDKTFNTKEATACVHAFIDANDGTVHQHMPWGQRGWHAGSPANDLYIGIEMCESDAIKYDSGYRIIIKDHDKALRHCHTAYKAAVELFAYLCTVYHLDPMTDIISHKEGHEIGVATNHGDPEHYWEALKSGYTMNGFRRDVHERMNGDKDSVCIVRVTIEDLHIRKEPNGEILCFIPKGAYTIVEKVGNWGKLKSDAGWIYIGNSSWTPIL